MIKTTSLKILSFGFFIISLTYSVLLLTSQAHDLVTLILTFGSAVLIDGFKMVSFFFSVHEFNKKRIITGVIFSIVFVFLFAISIIGSLGYMYNTNLQATAIDTKKSDTYTRNENMFSTKKQEIDNLKNQLTGISKSYDEQINSLPDDYITAKRNLSADKQNALSEVQNRIDLANKELDTINSNFENIKATDASISGYNAIFTQIAKLLNNSNYATKEYTAQDISFMFFVMVSLIFEISAVLCYLKSQTTKSDIDVKSIKKVGFTKDVPQEIRATKKDDDVTGFSSYEKSIEGTKEYNIYIKKMLDNTSLDENGYRTIGYKKIGKLANLNLTQTNQIYNYLKEAKDIKVNNMNTYLNSDELIRAFEESKKRKIGFIQS